MIRLLAIVLICRRDTLQAWRPRNSNILRPAQFYEEHKIDLHLGEHWPRSIFTIGMFRWNTVPNMLSAPFFSLWALRRYKVDIPGAWASARPLFPHSNGQPHDCCQCSDVTESRVIGASFIGLEVEASLRVRNIHVHVVAPDTDPDGTDFGPDV